MQKLKRWLSMALAVMVLLAAVPVAVSAQCSHVWDDNGKCTICGAVDSSNWGEMDEDENGHTHSYTDTVISPTCLTGGYTTHTCSCGHSYRDAETAPKGHTWDEGTVTREPTEISEGEKKFTCTVCGEIRRETLPRLEHTHRYTDTVTQPTCTRGGYTIHTCPCGHSYRDSEVPALGHSYSGERCTVCGALNLNWGITPQTQRLAGSHRYETAFRAADQMKQNLGIEKFDTVVVASGKDFADALSGSYLAAVQNAPILLACDVDWINELVKTYIRENLKSGGMVYILGGEKAIPDAFADGLEDFAVRRLAGGNRFETNLKVLEEAGVGDKPILVCTGMGFADSLSASATKLPILLVYQNELLAGQETFMETVKDRDLYIIGGTGAVSAQLEEQLKGCGNVGRLAGSDRFDTSVLIAQTFFSGSQSAVLAYAWDFPDGLCGGPLAATLGAPLILTMEGYETKAAGYIQGQSIMEGLILGGEKLIPEASVNTIFGIE